MFPVLSGHPVSARWWRGDRMADHARTLVAVLRRIVGFVADDVGDWVALLECGHRQHVRHDPPLRPAPWVEDRDERDRRIGTTVNCPLCDRCEVPDGLVVVRTSPTWDERSMPETLRREHRVASGLWGRLRVEDGSVRFVARTAPTTDVMVASDRPQGIAPMSNITTSAKARLASPSTSSASRPERPALARQQPVFVREVLETPSSPWISTATVASV